MRLDNGIWKGKNDLGRRGKWRKKMGREDMQRWIPEFLRDRPKWTAVGSVRKDRKLIDAIKIFL
jgi:hypothetical protein